MDFVSKLQDKEYFIRVEEDSKYWLVTLQEKGQK